MKKILLTTALLTSLCSTASAFSLLDKSSFNEKQKAEIESIIQEYIISNPEVLIGSLQRFEAEMQRKQQEAEAKQDVENIKSNYAAIFENEFLPRFGGTPDSKVVVEFYDYNCTYCQSSAKDFKEATLETNSARIYVNMPILSQDSYNAAWVSQAVMTHYSDKFEEFHNGLMELQVQVNLELAMMIAENLKIDVNELRNKMNDENVLQTLKANLKLAEILKIEGTPAFLIEEGIMRGAPSKDILIGILSN